jgi:hypothetical protein
MDIMPAGPVFFSGQEEEVAPPGSPRTYRVAALTYREKQAFRADHAREGGIYPTREQLLAALRAAVRAAAPANEPALLAAIDTAEADAAGEDAEAQATLAAIEAQLSDDPEYAALVGQRRRWSGMLPFCLARHALRGWDGPGLPPFARARGAVPAELLDMLPEGDIEAVGTAALRLMHPDRSAEGNSAAPSQSPASPAPTPEG